MQNLVNQILVLAGNTAPATVGQTPEDLAIGQVGVFDVNTNLAVNASSKVREFFIAVGVDRDKDTVVDGIVQSAGQHIQAKGVKDYNFRPHTPGQAQILKVAGYDSPKCDTDYNLKVELFNQQIYRTQGFNQFTKPYSVRTSCCEGCENCGGADRNELSLLFYNAIYADRATNFLTVSIRATQALTIVTHGVAADLAQDAIVPTTDIAALIAFNALQADDTTKVSTYLQLETNSLALKNYCNVNTLYFNPRETKAVVTWSPTSGDAYDPCIGTVTETQALAFSEGAGYDVKEKEYYASSNNGTVGPYVSYVQTGLAKNTFEFYADLAVNYDQFVLGYENRSKSGNWGTYDNFMSTEIAIPTDAPLARNGLAAILDGLLANEGFDTLADDSAAADANDANLEPTSGKTVATDGIA